MGAIRALLKQLNKKKSISGVAGQGKQLNKTCLILTESADLGS
jgi:hypothetical protein